MISPTPYLSFDGNCTEAMRFYAEALGADLQVLMTTGESPMAADCPEADADRILHARLALPGGGLLMGADCPTSMPYEGIQGVSLALDYDTVAAAEKVFAALCDGGQVTMPMQPCFWAKAFGMCVDRYGVNWMVNGEQQPF